MISFASLSACVTGSAIIGAGLLLDFERTFIEIEDCGTRFARQFKRYLQLVIVTFSLNQFHIHPRGEDGGGKPTFPTLEVLE